MSEAQNAHADWVLLEAAKRTGLLVGNAEYFKEYAKCSQAYSALCDMIAKHEQPPVDPDVEAVKRIINAWRPSDMDGLNFEAYSNHLARAVAQYKQERAK